MKKQIVLGLIAATLMSPSAFAVKEGGGGDVIQCGTGVLQALIPFGLLSEFFAPKDVSLADFGASYAETFSSFDPTPFTFEEVKTGLLNWMDTNEPAEASELRQSLSELKFNYVSKVQDLNTGLKIPSMAVLWSGCKKKQIAVQDFDTHEVNVVKPLFDALNHYEQGLLHFHEAYVNIDHRETSDLIAIETKARAQIAPFAIPSVAMQQAIIDAHFAGGSDRLNASVASEIAHQCGGQMQDDSYFRDDPYPGVAPVTPNSFDMANGVNSYWGCLRGTFSKLGVFCTSDKLRTPDAPDYTISSVAITLQLCSAPHGFSATSSQVAAAMKASGH